MTGSSRSTGTPSIVATTMSEPPPSSILKTGSRDAERPTREAAGAFLVGWVRAAVGDSAGSRRAPPSTHPIVGDELRALRRLQREQEPKSPFVFTSERDRHLRRLAARMVEQAGTLAKLSFKAHPHMLRHACGYALANKGHDTRALQAYLGHRNIQHTVRYTELSSTRFKDFWRN